jgi:hypothetical protein
VEHLARKGEMAYAYKILAGKSGGKTKLTRSGSRREKILKLIL